MWLAAISVSVQAVAASPRVNELIVRFQSESEFLQQAEVADELVKVATLNDIPSLEPWLIHEDRRFRGNAAYVFTKLGDRRGLDTLLSILTDFSDQRTIHSFNIGIAPVSAGSRVKENLQATYKRNPGVVRSQITADRYYAVHLLGELRDARAVGALLPLLDDDQINYKVAWALGEIGDHRAVQGLIAALSNSDALVRVSAIEALEKLRAGEAIPSLVAMFDDKALPSAGDQISVGVTARRAADTIRGGAVPHR